MTFAAKYTTSAKILAAISLNTKAHAKVDTEWHDIGMSVMAHIWEHRDVSVVNNLVIPMYTGLGKGARHAAMAEWLMSFLPVVANTDQATKNTHPFKFSKDKAKMEPDFDKAQATPWYSMKKSPTPDQLFDLNALIAQAFKKASEAAAKGLPVLVDRDQLVLAAKAFGVAESDLPTAGACFKNKAELAAHNKTLAEADEKAKKPETTTA